MVFKPKRNYEWNPDTGYHPSIDANIVGGVIEQLEEQNGGVTADAFLEASRPENSPTHSVFEWNDGIAAENWRKQQSRTTINALRVVYIDRQGEEQKVSASPCIRWEEESCTELELDENLQSWSWILAPCPRG